MNCNGLCTLEQQNYGIEINLGKDEPKLNILQKLAIIGKMPIQCLQHAYKYLQCVVHSNKFFCW